MNYEVGQMKPLQREQDDDDWETADLSGTAPPKQAVKPSAAALRPSAPAFVPRPAVPPKTLYQPGVETKKPTMDDEWFGAKRPVTNRQIWESANNTAPPTVIAPSAVHSDAGMIGTQMPPAPVMQILRRPTDSAANSNRRTTPNTGPKTLEKREEDYRLARERIFGPSSAGLDTVQVGSAPRSGSGTPTGVRSQGDSPQPGFGGGFPGGEAGVGIGGPKRSTGILERKNSSPGIMRQPKGPSEGGGFER